MAHKGRITANDMGTGKLKVQNRISYEELLRDHSRLNELTRFQQDELTKLRWELDALKFKKAMNIE
jgi:hypothetical protein